jgi:succinate dehydrogenase / fumarate reductase iron-sulfur subunit
MVGVMEEEGFGACTNHGECMAACPKEISIDFIARLNRDYLRAAFGAYPSERAGEPTEG